MVGLNDGAPSSETTSVTDSLSTSFTQAVTVTKAPLVIAVASIYYGTASSSGSDTITVTFSPFAEVADVYVYEVSGVTTAGVATATGTGTTCGNACIDSFSTSSSTSFSSGAFLLGVITDANGGSSTLTTGSGFIQSLWKETPFVPPFPWFAEYSLPGVSSSTNFPASVTSYMFSGDPWVEAGIALNPSTAPPIPEYPVGVAVLAVLHAPCLRNDSTPNHKQEPLGPKSIATFFVRSQR